MRKKKSEVVIMDKSIFTRLVKRGLVNCARCGEIIKLGEKYRRTLTGGKVHKVYHEKHLRRI